MTFFEMYLIEEPVLPFSNCLKIKFFCSFREDIDKFSNYHYELPIEPAGKNLLSSQIKSST